MLQALGEDGVKPRFDSLFAGGTPLPDDTSFPAPDEVADAWREMALRLETSLRTVSPATLTRPIPAGARSFDGTIGGMLAGAAFHEAYHVGQLGYLTRWLGHPSLLEVLRQPT